ncbi:MAG: PEP-CTERM sorting domain-containing protein [Phycisphaerae bacterium]|nr:PEP-CTERM sorting domain-containing protein [Phycisphaerae bacterium]
MRSAIMSCFVLVLSVPGSALGASFSDDFSDDAYTQSNWTFFDVQFDGSFSLRSATGVADQGVLSLSSDAATPPYFAHYAIGVANQAFDGPYTRVRTAVSWTQEQLDARLQKQIALRANTDTFTTHLLNLDPGSVGINCFSLRRIVNGSEYSTQDGPTITYEAGVVYNVEFGIDGDQLWGRLWVGDSYDDPLAEVFATNDEIPWGSITGNTQVGVRTYLMDPYTPAVVDSAFHGNTQFGGVFDVVPEPASLLLLALGGAGAACGRRA